MPWPMVHFAIAEKMYRKDVHPSFLLGSIAPDAIHTRQNASRLDKRQTHLANERIRLPEINMIKDFYFTNRQLIDDEAWRPFLLGYAAHIFADVRWTHTVYKDYEQKTLNNLWFKLRYRFKPIKAVYNVEVKQIDFDLYHQEIWVNECFNKLKIGKSFSVPPLVTDLEVDGWKQRTMDLLADQQNEPGIKPRYFTMDVVKGFIEQTSSELKELFIDWEVWEQ